LGSHATAHRSPRAPQPDLLVTERRELYRLSSPPPLPTAARHELQAYDNAARTSLSIIAAGDVPPSHMRVAATTVAGRDEARIEITVHSSLYKTKLYNLHDKN